MDVRRMMGRLNAANVRYDVGRGGLPELTPQDIAAAVAMIRDPLAKSIFCWAWWADGAALTNDQVLGQLRARLWGEQGDRALEHTKARWAHAHARSEATARKRITEDDRAQLARLEGIERRAAARTWPASPEVYPRIVRGVLAELTSPRHCPDCAGRGNVSSEFGPRPCPRCASTGTVAYPNTRRAEVLDINESTYRRIWSPVYEWAYALVVDLEQDAARQLARAIGSLNDLHENSA